jgi:hypothetical protein
VSNDFTLLVRQAPIIQLLTAANSLGITVNKFLLSSLKCYS